MALIKHYRKDDNDKWIMSEIKYDGFAYQWIVENIRNGVNFSVFIGEACDENEISRTDRMLTATDVSIMEAPSGIISGATALVTAIFAEGAKLLIPAPEPQGNLNRTQSSPNNELSNRQNISRPNQRIVDVIGQVKSIPDTIQKEYSRFVDGIEERIGAYCFARNRVDVADLRDGDNLIADISGASAGIYYPFKSPNNSAPDVQIGEPINQPIVGVYQSTNATGQTLEPNILADTYKITTVKVDRLLFNVYARGGLYKRAGGDKENVTVNFTVGYYLLNDNFERIGALQQVQSSISGATDKQLGVTVDVDLGGKFYIEWQVIRTTPEDTEYQGSVVDTIKLKDMFGLYDIDRTDFGNITMVQTKRKALEQVTAITNPEINAIVTEMVYKYQGAGIFDTVLTKNTQAFQSIISKALDPKIGRMQASDLDLDLFLDTQSEIETYFQTERAGQCSYSLDSTSTTAQDAFFLIANAVNCILWREGRVMKSWFESPQTVPEMIFTHRSKQGGSETWNRNFKQEKDGVSFKYIDDVTYKQEVLTYPPGALNTKNFEISGIRGVELATWRMMREYNKLVGQRVSVDFTATQEGRFVKPSKLISVVKGSRVGSTDGYVIAVDLLFVELSQEVTFTPGDDHSIIFKKRDGSTQSITCLETANKRIVELEFAPIEALYTGNDALKTEFSFGNDARLHGQLMLPQTIDASDRNYTRITAVNYSADYYKDDAIQVIKSAFSDGFSSAFF